MEKTILRFQLKLYVFSEAAAMGDLVPDWAIFAVIAVLIVLALGLLIAEVTASRKRKRGLGSDL